MRYASEWIIRLDKKGLPHYEPLPVKRTVKNQKILATSNRNVAGCFLWKADTVSQSLQ